MFSIINIILFPLFTIPKRLNFHEGKMEEKIYECFQKQTESEYNGRKRRPKIHKFHPIEYVDLIPPKEEKDSTNNEDESENQRLKFFVKKS